MSGQDRIYEMITERFIEQLQQGVVPWRKPWGLGSSEWPRNIKSKKLYRGTNVLNLATSGHRSPWWGTFDQMAAASGMTKVADNNKRGYYWESPDGTPRGVRRGSKGQVIIFWKNLWVTETDPDTGEPTRKRIPFLRYTYAYNAEQVDHLPEEYYPAEDEPYEPDLALKRGQEILDGYLGRDGAPGFFEDGGDKAYYGLERDDNIHLPVRAAFPDERKYYSTAFHEATHSTGHPKRCDRPGIRNFDHFGSGQYAKEELVAEIGAAFLMGLAGIDTEGTFTNSAAYVGNWLSALRHDHKLVVQAAAQAQHAVDFILGVEFEEHEEEGEES